MGAAIDPLKGEDHTRNKILCEFNKGAEDIMIAYGRNASENMEIHSDIEPILNNLTIMYAHYNGNIFQKYTKFKPYQ